MRSKITLSKIYFCCQNYSQSLSVFLSLCVSVSVSFSCSLSLSLVLSRFLSVSTSCNLFFPCHPLCLLCHAANNYVMQSTHSQTSSVTLSLPSPAALGYNCTTDFFINIDKDAVNAVEVLLNTSGLPSLRQVVWTLLAGKPASFNVERFSFLIPANYSNEFTVSCIIGTRKKISKDEKYQLSEHILVTVINIILTNGMRYPKGEEYALTKTNSYNDFRSRK